jgi:uncharacterized membrane protein (Fun14 family)
MTEKKDLVEQAIEKAKPILQNLGFGAVVGYCSGIAMKKVGKLLAVTIGIGFIGLQTVVSLGYITVDWEKVKVSFVKSVDTDGDGKISTADYKVYWQKVKKVLTHKIPSAGGFSFGFLYGVRYG